VQEVDHSRSDCLAVTILSHGDETRVWGRDGAFLAEELWTPFEGDKCPSLADKPKIFISNTCQACRNLIMID
jgi:Caspase domain